MEIRTHIWEEMIFPDFEDNLIIHFETPVWNDAIEYRVSAKVFWKKNKVDIYVLDEIFITNSFQIEYTFQNGITIRGTLEIQKFSDFNSNDSLGIFADFYYYYYDESPNCIWHTEGFLISFNPKNTIPGEIPEIDIINESDDDFIPVKPMITPDTYSDLFPYIYLSGWPKCSNSEQSFNFFYYKPYTTSPPGSSFINKLATLKSLSDRYGMEKEAVFFIQKKTPYQSLYITNVTELEGYIGRFIWFYDCLTDEEYLVLVIEQACIFFNTDVTDFAGYLKSDAYFKNKERLWQSYIALIIEMGYQNENLMDIIKVLTLCNFLEIVFDHLDTLQLQTTLDLIYLRSLFQATIVLEKNIFPLPPYKSSPPVNPPPIIFPYAIGDLQLVKYKLERYEIGELASITSIMPGEKRKLIHRKLDRVIDKEVLKTTSINQSDTSNKENSNDFNKELWNAIAETTETTNYPDPGLVSSYGPPTNITVKGTYTKTQTTQTPDKKQLSSFAKKVLNKTTQRLSEKVNKVRAHTELKESEDTSVSVVNNSTNKEAVYGMHCWLNKVYKTEVINYGNRMLFSFIIPNPAEAYKAKIKVLNGSNFQVPKSLEDFKINSYQDITKENYLVVSQYYQLKKIPLYPQETIVVSDIVTLSQSKLITLPDLYIASTATIEYAFGSGSAHTIVSGFLGENTFTFKKETSAIGTKEFTSLNNEQNTIAISAVYTPSIDMSPPNSEVNFQMAVSVKCTPLPQTILAWQIELYQLFEEAFIKKINAYNLEMGVSNKKKEVVNPLLQRDTITQELEKSIRKQLLENGLQIKGLPIDKTYPQLHPTIKYNQTEIMQYLNSSLEWNEMSYTFFDAYDHQDGFFSTTVLSPDFFSAFLKASCARVVIPVRPEFNYGFLYYLNTGIIWSSRDSLAPCFADVANNETINSDQLSIVYELKKIFSVERFLPKVIDSWEVTIPTSMQILQPKKHIKIAHHE